MSVNAIDPYMDTSPNWSMRRTHIWVVVSHIIPKEACTHTIWLATMRAQT